MNLTVFLLRRKFASLAAVPIPDGYYEIAAAANPGKAVRVLLKQNSLKTPPWVKWLGALGIALDGATPQNQSASGLVLISAKSKTRERVFAVAFGHGWSSITAGIFQSRYGLDCASRLIDPERVMHMRTLRPDMNPLEVSTFRASSGKPDEFGLDLGIDVFAALAGRPSTASPVVGSFFAGTDCLRIRSWKGDFTDLKKVLRHTLKLLRRPLPPDLKFLDDVQRVREPKLRAKLNDALHKQLAHQTGTTNARLVVLALPLEAELEGTDFTLTVATKDFILGSPTQKGLEGVIAAEGLTSKNLSKANLSFRDVNGEVTRARLARFLEAEVKHGGKSYLFLRGIWLLPGQNYVTGLNARIAALPPWPSASKLPPWPMGMKEDAFNANIANSLSSLLQDQKFFYRGTSKIEPCDVLTDKWEFVHVKAGKTSAVWNHLFSQATVSARLMRNDASYIADIEARYVAQWPTSAAKSKHFSVVLLMGGKKKGTIQVPRLPLFSKIAFAEAIRSLRGLGVTVYLSVIPRT